MNTTPPFHAGLPCPKNNLFKSCWHSWSTLTDSNVDVFKRPSPMTGGFSLFDCHIFQRKQSFNKCIKWTGFINSETVDSGIASHFYAWAKDNGKVPVVSSVWRLISKVPCRLTKVCNCPSQRRRSSLSGSEKSGHGVAELISQSGTFVNRMKCENQSNGWPMYVSWMIRDG